MASTVAAAGPPARVNCAAARTTAARTRALRGLPRRPGCTVWVAVSPCVPLFVDTMSSILLSAVQPSPTGTAVKGQASVDAIAHLRTRDRHTRDSHTRGGRRGHRLHRNGFPLIG